MARKGRKGLKIDCKDFSSALYAYQEITTKPPVYNVPLFFNADILVGPGNNPTKFVATDFCTLGQQLANNYSNTILSLGWTTAPPDPANPQPYTEAMVDEMLDETSNIKTHITYPLRAGLVQASWPALQKLLEIENRSFTIWNNEKVSTAEREWLLSCLPPDKTCYDLIDY